MPHIAAMDLFVVPTISFNLYVLVIVRLPAAACLDQRDRKPDSRMDRATGDRRS